MRITSPLVPARRARARVLLVAALGAALVGVGLAGCSLGSVGGTITEEAAFQPQPVPQLAE